MSGAPSYKRMKIYEDMDTETVTTQSKNNLRNAGMGGFLSGKNKSLRPRQVLVDDTNTILELTKRCSIMRVTPTSGMGDEIKDTDGRVTYSTTGLENTPRNSFGTALKVAMETKLCQLKCTIHPDVLVDMDESAEYEPIVRKNMQVRQYDFQIEGDIMEKQTTVDWPERAIVVDWFVELQCVLGIDIEALYLGVSILDRYLEKEDVHIHDLQLVGATSMMIATKVEESVIEELPTVGTREIHDLTCDLYSEDEVLKTERRILNAIDFQVIVPSPHQFLIHFTRGDWIGQERIRVSEYVLELSLLAQSCRTILPSKLAAAALWLSLKLPPLISYEWGTTAVVNCGYEEEDLIEVASKLNDVVVEIQRENKLINIKRKYSSNDRFRASYITPLNPENMAEKKLWKRQVLYKTNQKSAIDYGTNCKQTKHQMNFKVGALLSKAMA